jgi:hypothetical protein
MVAIVSLASLVIYFLTIVDTISGGTVLHSVVVLDDVLESPRLQLHLHQKHPIRVIYLCESKVATPASTSQITIWITTPSLEATVTTRIET